MSVNDTDFTLPESCIGATFTEAEWARAKKAEERIRKKLAARCKHLIKGEAPQQRKIDWDKIRQERERLDQDLQDAERIARGFG